VFNASSAEFDLSSEIPLGLRLFVDGKPHFVSLLNNDKMPKNHGKERKGEQTPSGGFPADRLAGPKGILPAFEFPSAADLAAAEGTAKELQEFAVLRERLVRTALSR
jgi:hypothetical protein